MATNRFDIAYQQTDDVIAEIEKRIAKEYKKAHKEVTQKWKDYLKKSEAKDKIWQEWVKEGKKTPDEYAKWRIGQICMGERWAEMKDTLAEDYTNTAEIAQSIAKGYRPEVYALNHNYATFDIEKQSQLDTSYTLYSRESVERMYRDNPKLYHDPGKKTALDIKEGKVKRWNKQRVQSVITQGILQGESIPQLAKRLEKVTQGGFSAAVRNARTMMTGVQNAGRIDAQNRAKGMGIPVRKQWLATLDKRTRDWHVDLDGKIVDTDKPFVNTIGKIDFPGDPKADAANVYNCRCCLITAIKGFEIDASDLSLRDTSHMEEETYEQWKNRHKEDKGKEKESTQYKTFTDGKSANTYFGERPDIRLRREDREEYNKQRNEFENSTYGSWYYGLTDKETTAIANYSGDAYAGINGLLRHQMTEKMVDTWNATENMSIQNMIEHIDSAIDKFELKDPIKVYRTCESDVLTNLKLEKGSLFHDDGFGSTSVLSEKVASGNIVMEINVPSGKGYGAWINPLSGAQDEEYEFLLQRGSDYKVTDITKRGEDTVVSLDLLGNTKTDWSYASKEEVIRQWKDKGIYNDYNADKI